MARAKCVGNSTARFGEVTETPPLPLCQRAAQGPPGASPHNQGRMDFLSGPVLAAIPRERKG
jgi:hypothetical protein